MTNRINQIVTSLLDDAVKAAVRSDWNEVSRLCTEVIGLDSDNPEAIKMLSAAERSLSRVDGKPTVQIPAIPTFSGYSDLEQSFHRLDPSRSWAKVSIMVTMISLVLATFANIMQINLTNYIDNAPWTVYPAERVDTTNLIQGLIGMLYLIAYAASVISFLVWLQKASRNLPLIGIKHPEYTPGWVVGWWFIPVANLFKPYQVMKNVLSGSVRSKPEDPMWLKLKWFWGLHLAGNMIAWQGVRTTDFLAGNYYSIVGNSMLFVAGLLLVSYVSRVTSGQRAWHSSAISTIDPAA